MTRSPWASSRACLAASSWRAMGVSWNWAPSASIGEVAVWPAEVGAGGDAVEDEGRLDERWLEVGEDEVVGGVLEFGFGGDVALGEGLVEVFGLAA